MCNVGSSLFYYKSTVSYLNESGKSFSYRTVAPGVSLSLIHI